MKLDTFNRAQGIARANGELPMLKPARVFGTKKQPNRAARKKADRDLIREYC